MRKKIISLAMLIRWSSWSNTKLVFLFISLGIIIQQKSITSLATQTILIVISSLLFVIYGSFISIVNDYWDIKIDKEAKKTRNIARLSATMTCGAQVVLFIIYTTLLVLLANKKHEVIFLGIFTIILGFLYSHPLFRLKEKSWAGVIVGSLIQRSLPLLIMFAILNCLNTATLALISLTFFLGLKLMLMHQIEDYATDLKSGVKTLLTSIGIKRGKGIIKWLYIFESIFFVFFLLTLKEQSICFLTISYFIFWSIAVITKPKIKKTIEVFSLNNFFMSDYYYVWLPIYIGTMVFWETKNPLLLLIFLFLQKKHILIFLNKL